MEESCVPGALPWHHCHYLCERNRKLPPIEREGDVLTHVCPSVCPQGGYPYPIMLCNITKNAMGQGEIPCQVQGGGILPGPGGGRGTLPGPGRGGTQLGVPCQVHAGVPYQGGTKVGYPPPARSGWRGTLPGELPR